MPATATRRRKAAPKPWAGYTPEAANRMAALRKRAVLFEQGPIDLPTLSTGRVALEGHKKKMKGDIRIQKEKRTGEINQVNLTNHGKFDQLFSLPAQRKWDQLKPEQQKRMFEHYIFTTMKFLTGAQQKTSTHGTHRLTLSEAREARLPFLEKTLTRMREKIRAKNTELDRARISLTNPYAERPYTREQVDALRKHVNELENRATIAGGVIERLRMEDPYSEPMMDAELGKKNAEALRKRQPAFSQEAGQRLLALHTRLTEMEHGRTGAADHARERISAQNKNYAKGMKVTDPAFGQIEELKARGRMPSQEIIPEFRTRYTGTLHTIKGERRGLVRVKKNKESHQVEEVHLTSRGKFRQLFLNPSTRKWDEYSSTQQDRMLQHYIGITTKYLTSTNQRIGDQSRRMKLNEAREARTPMLNSALRELENEIDKRSRDIDMIQQNMTGGGVDAQTRNYIRGLSAEREGLENRASVLRGVVSRLESGSYRPELALDAESRGKRKHGTPSPARKGPARPRAPRKTTPAIEPRQPTPVPATPSEPRPTPTPSRSTSTALVPVGKPYSRRRYDYTGVTRGTNRRAVPRSAPRNTEREVRIPEPVPTREAKPNTALEEADRIRADNERRHARLELQRTGAKRRAAMGWTGRLKRRARVNMKIIGRKKGQYAQDLRRKGTFLQRVKRTLFGNEKKK